MWWGQDEVGVPESTRCTCRIPGLPEWRRACWEVRMRWRPARNRTMGRTEQLSLLEGGREKGGGYPPIAGLRREQGVTGEKGH